MAKRLEGKPVAEAIASKIADRREKLNELGVEPCLAVVRIGENESDLSYEKGLSKRCEKLGIALKKSVFPQDVSPEEIYAEIKKLNDDKEVHGVLVFRPLPKSIDEEKLFALLDPQKEVDCCTEVSLASVLTGKGRGYMPCTAEAVIKLFDHYGIELKGKSAAVIGRSLVIGRPAAMMLMQRDATVTICHTKTPNTAEIAKNSDILIACAGKASCVTADYMNSHQVIADVGINWNEAAQKICGDVDLEAAESIAEAYTPVPGGIGSITTSVLCEHVVLAAERFAGVCK